MARLVTVAGLALVLGILIGIGAVSLRRAADAPTARAIKEPEPTAVPMAVIEAPGHRRVIKLASPAPSTAPLIGTMAVAMVEKLATASDGNIEFKLFEPNTLAPNDELFDKVSAGDIDAVWSSANFFAARDSAFWLFSTVPFGPPASEYLAWLSYGGGQQLMDESFARFNIKPVVCTILPPESGGWFRREIASAADLNGLRMRFMGIGARVISQLGVEVVPLNGGQIFDALQTGNIDAAEFSLPATDLRFGLDKAATHFYFPGWHQQSSLISLLFNTKVWESFTDAQRGLILSVCGDTVRESLAEGEAQQVKALQEIRARGVTIHTLPQPVMGALKTAWIKVVKEESAANPEFSKVWDSYYGFRKAYAEWRNLGYLP
ncbi:TRAP transporter substrate-binding protein [Ferrovibrio sp.]|uniref:TRAP transporter substrate-binding protein n=1 Tax=Ferrovibrio sp. TaxID=1917215 RepID=UPI002637EEFA|nr:TRAP transporter substrate-binding protein [Ferrovibrio sp.]